MRNGARVTTGRAVWAASVVGLLVAAGCSSGGGAVADRADDPAQDGQRYTISMITHEAPGDSFWDKVRAGAERSAADLGVELRYANSADAGQQATLVQNAVDSGVDGIAVTLAYADQVGPAAQRAAAGGTPVVALNAGIAQYQGYGISMFFGSDDTVAGRSAGQRIADAGGAKALCVIHEQGSVSHAARCNGVRESFRNVEELQVNGTDIASVQQTIGAKLQQDPTVTHVLTLGAPFAIAAQGAVATAGSSARVVTFDLNAEVAAAIQAGTIDFAVDQQPYVQGYLAVQALWLNLSNANDIGGGGPVLTGPSYVDAANVAAVAEYAAAGTR